MNKLLQLSPFGLLAGLVLASTLALAQPATSDGADQAQTQHTPDKAEKVDKAPQPGKNTTTTANKTTKSPDSSPYDYRPSEEISEDLSVSFPVDI